MYDESLRGIADRRARSGGGGGGGGGGAEAWNGDGAAKCYKMRVSDGDLAASLWEEDGHALQNKNPNVVVKSCVCLALTQPFKTF